MNFHNSGQTDNNKNRLAQGDLDSHLNDDGIKEAKLLSTRLASVKLTEIITSELLRAVETAEALYSNQPNSLFVQSSQLKERSLGADEGKPYEYFYGKNTLIDRDNKPNQGESLNDVFYRSQSLLNELIHKYVNELYSLDINIESIKEKIIIKSYDLIEESFNKGTYTDKSMNKDTLTKIALVTHAVPIKEILNNILLLKDYSLIEWARIKNTAIFIISIFCPNCLGKCFNPITCKSGLSFSIDMLNDFSHMN